MINVNTEENRFWKKYTKNHAYIWFKGYIYSHTIDEMIEECTQIDKNKIDTFINSIDGHFALIVQRDDLSFMAVDKVRTTPLFFIQIKHVFFIDNDPKKLVLLDSFDNTICSDAVLEISMAGYTIGNKTIYKKLHSLKAGELVIFENNKYKYVQYYKYFDVIEQNNYENYIDDLSQVTLNIFKKILDQIGDRQIIIPLSAGNDSRLVASALKHLGAINVKCYSYGSIGNFEANIAKVVSEKLGYEWVFVPLTHSKEKKYYASKEYKEYLAYCESYASVPYIQSLSTIKYLKEINYIDDDAIFINGNSGDFISGLHINKMMKSIEKLSSYEERKENILNNLIDKHFSLWGYLKTEENLSLIKKNLWNEIILACGDLKEKELDHLYYEYSEFIDRQSSYVISGQKAYEFYGHEWRLPLWDDEYLYFWQKIPAKFKIDQKLYVDMLKKKNFGNVWGDDIPVNKKVITPIWIVPLRFICKIPFGLFGTKGKDAWKNFEKSVFYYWMDVTHMSDTTNYLRMVRDVFKMPRSHVSWQTEDYLENLIKEI